MSESFPLVPLGDVARPVVRPEVPTPGKPYRQVGVRLWGEGAYERETIDGSQTKYGTLSRVEQGDIIVNKIWARNGSVAVVQNDVAGCYGSGEFPTFAPNREKLDPRWFHWLTKTRSFWEQCDEKSRGTSGQNRIRPERFMEIMVPLPPLAEQRRIVARIEALAGKNAEARGLRRGAVEDVEALAASESKRTFSTISQKHTPRPFGDFAPHVTSGPRNWGALYADSGARFYRAQDIGADGNLSGNSKVFIEPPMSNQGQSARPLPGDLMVVITGATVGRCALFSSSMEPGYISQHVALCRLPHEHINPQYALWGLRSPLGQEQLLGQRYGQGKPGLNLGNIRALSLPIPPLPDQHRVVAYLDGLQAKVDALKALQAKTAAELDALLPAVLDKAFKGEL